jgi:hypothetical protein
VRRFAPALLLVARAVTAAPPPLALEVEIAPPQATVGELVTATLTLRGAAGDPARTPRFPDWSRGWGEAEVREARAPQRFDAPDGAEWRQQIVLAAFATGRIALPPVAVAIPGEPPVAVATPAGLAVEVRSVLPADGGDVPPRPPAPPRRLELPSTFGWTVAALALAALAAALLLARRRPGAGATEAARLSPWGELVRTLDALDGSAPERAHVALSLALRRFLGRSFQMPAAQSSTSELGRRLGRRGLERALVRRVVGLLGEIDQVKFARAAATAPDLARRVAEARELAQAVDSHLHPPSAEAAA